MKTLVKWTVEDYHRMIEAGILAERRCELIDGEIIEMAPEGGKHHIANWRVADYLRERLRGTALVSEAHPVTLPHLNSEPEPDVAVVFLPFERYNNRHPYTEDIYFLIEIADSSLPKDTGEKLKLYAQASIPEYWIIDVNTKQITVCREPVADSYRSQLIFTEGTIAPLAFPNMAISVERLLKGSNE